jgi:hypothetical protein
MTDRITANLPSRDTNATAAFYQKLGFTRITMTAGGWSSGAARWSLSSSTCRI